MSDRVPGALVGAWRRESLAIQGMDPFEDSCVIWLQSPSRYADVRVPLPGADAQPESFGGRQEWQEPRLTFHHELDYTGRFPQDSGILSRDGDILIEDGSVDLDGKTISYRERWVLQTPVHAAYLAVEARDENDRLQAIAVRVGEHAVVISRGDSFQAVYLTFEDGCPDRRWNIGELLKFEFPGVCAGGTFVELGLQWRCVEASYNPGTG